jgi:hypothetical protein
MDVKAEWHPAADFAEYAEALGIETKQIMAARPGKPVAVIYSPDLEDDLDPETPIYCAYFTRDQDRILRVVGEPYMLSFTWADMQREIEERMAELERDDDA